MNAPPTTNVVSRGSNFVECKTADDSYPICQKFELFSMSTLNLHGHVSDHKQTFTLIMNRTFIRAPTMKRQMASGTITNSLIILH